MPKFFKALSLSVVLAFMAVPVLAAPTPLTEQVLGKADAPITVDEYVSFTCSHCAHFYNEILPAIEKKYVATGKVKFILHDFPMDGVALKAASLARCMPSDEFYPFVKVLYKNIATWIANPNPEETLVQYAKLGGLGGDEAKACLNNTDLQNAIVAERTDGEQNYHVEATPTFIINHGAERIEGAQPVEEFEKVFDRLLAKKK